MNHHHRGGRREENGGTTGPDGDNETPSSALESAGPATVPSCPMSPSKNPYDGDDDNDDNYDEDDDDDSDDDDDRNGFSPPQDAKAAIVKYVTVRNTLRPVPAKSDTAGKSGDPGKIVGAQKFQFDVPNGLISEEMLEELRKQHPAAHILTSIAAQVSATQAQSADDASRALGLAYNGTNVAFGDGALQDRKYGAISGSFSDAGELMLAGSAGEGASDPTTDDAQVVDCASEEREVPSASSEMAPCLVCGDRGSGFHYSIFSCEGCKGFFKRTVQKNMVYACKDSGSCFINKTTRNNCQACRFKKCIDVGMKKEAVREDRTPGGKHRLKRPRMEEPPAMAAAVGVSGLDADTITKLIEARPDMVPTIEELAIGSQTEELDVDDLMHFGYLELRFIIEWAKKVPGFSDLVLEDQMALLKSSFMELNLLRLAYRSLDCPGSIKFANEVILSAMQCVHLGWGHDLLNCILEFVTRLRNINIDNTEFCVLNAVVLTYPDAVGIVDKPSVVSLQSQMLNCLQTYSLTRYPNELRRFGLILLRLPALRTISAKAAEMFLSLSLEGNVKMNALVIEMMQ